MRKLEDYVGKYWIDKDTPNNEDTLVYANEISNIGEVVFVPANNPTDVWWYCKDEYILNKVMFPVRYMETPLYKKLRGK